MRTLGAHTERASELLFMRSDAVQFLIEFAFTALGARAPDTLCTTEQAACHGGLSNGGRAARKTQGSSGVIRGNQCAFSGTCSGRASSKLGLQLSQQLRIFTAKGMFRHPIHTTGRRRCRR